MSNALSSYFPIKQVIILICRIIIYASNDLLEKSKNLDVIEYNLRKIGKPAMRSIASAGFVQLEKFAKVSEAELFMHMSSTRKR